MRSSYTLKKIFSYSKYYIKNTFFIPRTMSTYPLAFVRHIEGEDQMKISFTFSNNELSDKEFTFLRPSDEKLETALFRIKFKIQNAIVTKHSKKKKKKLKGISNSDTSLPKLDVCVLNNNDVLDISLKNTDVWISGNKLKISDCVFEILKNPPSVFQISLPKNIMFGFPVYPKISLEFCKKDDCLFSWYKLITKAEKQAINAANTEILQYKSEFWLKLSEGYFYVTAFNDIGYKLRVSCLPQCDNVVGKLETATSSSVVEPGPGKCPFEDRHQCTKSLTGYGSFRCISYNILADLYADSDTARNELFPYCPTEALTLDYRKQLYLKEILGYNADLICLQEVDRKVFLDDLVPVLSSTGMEGVYNEKGGQVVEGLSCFYRTSKFKIIHSHAIVLAEALKTEPVLHKIYSKACENEKLTERILHRTTAMQVVLLESIDVPNKRVLVGNTHLYFRPQSDNIRLLQATSFILYLEKLLQDYQKEGSFSTSVMLCGDFNSCPEFGVYELVTQGFLQETCEDWNSDPEETVKGIPLSHTLSLDSACGVPKYTNFTEGFVGCLDYIFYDKNCLSVKDVVPFPTHEQVTEKIALPNQIFPSDHIALVCTLQWK